MKIVRVGFIIVSIICLLAFDATAQKKKSRKPAKRAAVQEPKPVHTEVKTTIQEPPVTLPALGATQDEKKVKDIVSFLEYMLNIVGNSSTPNRDKEVIITESYAKIFRDTKVQIEDDLVEARNVITNKDVVPYLKDVDFFFTDARFEFTIDNIETGTANGVTFYKVSTKRNLKGTTTEGESINKTIPRYIEINYDPNDQDLKIVSIYTNEFDQKVALTNWWKELSYEWKTLFKKKLNLTDSVTLDNIKSITSLEALDLSNNTSIQGIEPLSQLVNLKSLNLSNTNIKELTPIRNLTELKELSITNTRIQDLAALKYSINMVSLNINRTEVNDISVIQKMPALQHLDLSYTPVKDFTAIETLSKLVRLNLAATQFYNLAPVQKLTQLTELNVSATHIFELNSLTELKQLSELNVDSTQILSIEALSNLANLKILEANYTLLSDLKPLQKLTHLQKVYCDKTNITKIVADTFMATNPHVLVMYNSEDLKNWWEGLTKEWQNVLLKAARITSNSDLPSLTLTKEDLAKVPNIDSINLAGNSRIVELEPLRKLHKLQLINVTKTSVHDLSPLQDHKEIKYLNISDTDVSDISIIRQFVNLKELHADGSKIESLEPLYNLSKLKKLYVDHTAIQDITALEFLEKNTDCLILYKTIHLDRWWKGLSTQWKNVFHQQMTADTTSSRENLHTLVEQKILHFKDEPVNDLLALNEFIRLKELHFSGTNITEIPTLENLKSLTSLHASDGPLQKIDALSQLVLLQDLDISNTPIHDLKIIGSLKSIRMLNCAGTQIKKLNPLEGLQTLEFLDCSNTNVSNLDPVLHLTIKTLKCYNAKISKREIDSFKKSNPQCSVTYYK